MNRPDDKVPVIMTKDPKSISLIDLPNGGRFYVTNQYTFHEFKYIIRQKLQLGKYEGLFVTVRDGVAPAANKIMK